MATLLFQGHASCRLTTDRGMVIYIDPAVGDGYDLPADLVIITHEHGDHNNLSLVRQKPGCRVLRGADFLSPGAPKQIAVGEITVEKTEAKNKNHPPDQCMGVILTMDGISLYHAGDTSETAEMGTLSARRLDWALLPTDGIYNMGPEEASRCAILIGATHTVPIHTDPSYLYNRAIAERVSCPGLVLLEHGQSTAL